VIPTLDYAVDLLKLLISTYAVKICHCKISSEMGGKKHGHVYWIHDGNRP